MDAELLIRSDFGSAFADSSVLVDFAKAFEHHSYVAGATIIQEGQPQDRALIVAKGCVARRKYLEHDSITIDVLKPGAAAGFNHLIQNDEVQPPLHHQLCNSEQHTTTSYQEPTRTKESDREIGGCTGNNLCMQCGISIV
jgi:CRP-like cAMP-binding protein